MRWYTIKDEAKISAILRYLVSRQRELEIYMDSEEEAFRSRIVKINPLLSGKGEEAQIVIQMLDPGVGHELIQSSSEVRMEFIIKRKSCRCRTRYIGRVKDRGNFRFLLTFPLSVEVDEERRDERVKLGPLEPVSARLTVEKGAGKLKVYDLTFVDYSRHGLGLLVTRNEFDLLEELEVGDRIQDMVLYAPWAVIKVDGKVAHKTELQEGDHRGCFRLGIKSRELITKDKIGKR